ncbi:MAG: 3'-5' exonuclease [Kiritimatiellaceae bacterium]|nr:3'-5' exonuclease [Kiritimatiellaceae bacterium]
MLLRTAQLTVIDFETTGSVPGFDTEPWQVGAVRLVHGRIDKSHLFKSLIRVDIQRPFNAYAPGKHHALRDKIAAAPKASELWPTLEEWVSGYPLVAHNVATEKKFLRKMAPLHEFGPWIDTLTLTRQAWPYAPSHRLEDLIAGLHLEPRVRECCSKGEPHDALYDAVSGAVLLEYILTLPSWKQLKLPESNG